MSSVIDVRRAGERFHTRTGWLDSHHSFSFGHHRDPANTHFGLLLVSNDDVVAPGTGFETHPHRDMEIVTWVLDGALVHQDSTGHNGLIHPGLAQRMSAGTGILHSEKNDSWTLTGEPEHRTPVHFVQMWVIPDEAGITPGYEQLDIGDELDRGGWTTLASGMPGHAGRRAIGIRQKHAALHVARTVCRRAERTCVALSEMEGEIVGKPAIKYLNRLSDLLFVAARWSNDKGASDVLWKPGATR